MSWRSPSAEAHAWVADLGEAEWLPFARVLAAAVRIDHKVVRNLRRRFFPASDAGLESRLWWSRVVESRSALAVSMQPDVARALVDTSDATPTHDELETALEGCIEHWPALLQIEQRCRFALLRGDLAAVDSALKDVVKRYVQADETQRLEILSWCRGALPDLVAPEDGSEAASWLGMLTSNAWGDREDGAPLPIATTVATLPAWLSELQAGSSKHRVGLKLYVDSLEFVAPNGELDLPLDTPLPARLRIEAPGTKLAPRWETVELGRAIALPSGAARIALTTTLGVRYEIEALAASAPAFVPATIYFEEPDRESAERLAAALGSHGVEVSVKEPPLTPFDSALSRTVVLVSAASADRWQARTADLNLRKESLVVGLLDTATFDTATFDAGGETRPVELGAWLSSGEDDDLAPLLAALGRRRTDLRVHVIEAGDTPSPTYEALERDLERNGIRVERCRGDTDEKSFSAADLVVVIGEYAEPPGGSGGPLGRAVRLRTPLVWLEPHPSWDYAADVPNVAPWELASADQAALEARIRAWSEQLEREHSVHEHHVQEAAPAEAAQTQAESNATANAQVEIELWVDDATMELAKRITERVQAATGIAVLQRQWESDADDAMPARQPGARVYVTSEQAELAAFVVNALTEVVELRTSFVDGPPTERARGQRSRGNADVVQLAIVEARNVRELADYVAERAGEVLDTYYFLHRIGTDEGFRSHRFGWEAFRDLAGRLKSRSGSRPVFVVDDAESKAPEPKVAEHEFPAPHFALTVNHSLSAARVADAWLQTIARAGAEPVSDKNWFLEALKISARELSPASREFLGMAGKPQHSPVSWQAANLTIEIGDSGHSRETHAVATDRLRALGLEVVDSYSSDATTVLHDLRERIGRLAQERRDVDQGLILILRGYAAAGFNEDRLMANQERSIASSAEALSRTFPGCRHLIVFVETVELTNGRRPSAPGLPPRPNPDAADYLCVRRRIRSATSNDSRRRIRGAASTDSLGGEALLSFLDCVARLATIEHATSDDLRNRLAETFELSDPIEVFASGRPFRIELPILQHGELA